MMDAIVRGYRFDRHRDSPFYRSLLSSLVDVPRYVRLTVKHRPLIRHSHAIQVRLITVFINKRRVTTTGALIIRCM